MTHSDRRTLNPSNKSPKEYEDLEGAQGREVFFRPKRYSQQDLGPIQTAVEIVVGDTPHVCALRDVSQNGVAFRWPTALPRPALNEALSCLVVRFDAHEAYRGAAVVMSIREDDRDGTLVGVAFTDALMDIDDVLQLRDVRNWSVETARQLPVASKPWDVQGFEAYKALVAEFRLFLEEASKCLAELEKTIPWHVLHAPSNHPAHKALLERIEADFVPDYLRYSYAIDKALRGANSEEWSRLKEFSVRHLQTYLLQAPILERAYKKPLGYPGDFELMRFMYAKTAEGPTLFAKALHYAVNHLGACEAVRQRKNMIKRALRTLIESTPEGGRLRIASIAAGPARETVELVQELERCPPSSVEIVLFDQDQLALENAHARLARTSTRWPQIKIHFRHDSIKRLLQDPKMLQDHGPFNMIFCAGLFDYLRFSTATILCRTFYQLLAPAGHAWVGNMVDNPCRWSLEHVCDWYLTYRTREEMLSFGRAAAPEARLEIADEPTGINPCLVIEKRPS